MNNLKKLLLLAAALSSVGVANALNFDLLSPSATLVLSANTTSTFYEVTGAGAESGSASSLYSVLVGGDADSGFFVKISFDGNPQPILTSAFIKAANDYLWWDSTDLIGFNSGTFDSITLWNSGAAGEGIGHYTGGKDPQWKFQGTSHAGLNGRPGTNDIPRVADGGTSVMLLGAALSGLGLLRRKLKTN